VILYNHIPWYKSIFGAKPDAKRLAELEAEQLALEILQRELQLIDDRSRIDARKQKIAFINEWLSQ